MDNAKVLEEYGRYVDTRTAAEPPSSGGTVASDLSRFDNRRQVREAVQEATLSQRTERRSRPVPRTRFSFGLLLLYLVMAGLAALLISNYMTLTVLTEDLSNLEDELETLKNEEIILQKKYDERYILNDIETYAVNNLGMVKLESNMMEYIELSNPDTITVIDPYRDQKVSGFFSGIAEKLREILEFLA